MSALYPLLLKPIFNSRPWGSHDLAPIYPGFPGKDADPVGEAWLTGDECKVANGPLSGKSLREVVQQFGRALVGDHSPCEDQFPLLMKFLFPKDKLSVQVHPDDEGAKALGQACGKTECWYVLAAEPGAKIGLGLKPGTTHQELERAIHEVRAESLLNWIDVKSGDMFFVDAGTVHAIGAGVVVVETQQNSDTTFRLYDYGRPRELHVESGLKATKEKTRAGKVVGSKAPVLISSPWFAVERFKWSGGEPLTMDHNSSAQCLVAASGCAVVEAPGSEPVTLARGEAVVIPASVRGAAVRPQWDVELFRSLVPSASTAVSATELVTS